MEKTAQLDRSPEPLVVGLKVPAATSDADRAALARYLLLVHSGDPTILPMRSRQVEGVSSLALPAGVPWALTTRLRI